jgi:hypothetical protein
MLTSSSECKGTKAATKVPSVTSTAGTLKLVPADPPVEVTDGEEPSPDAHPAKKAKEATNQYYSFGIIPEAKVRGVLPTRSKKRNVKVSKCLCAV